MSENQPVQGHTDLDTCEKYPTEPCHFSYQMGQHLPPVGVCTCCGRANRKDVARQIAEAVAKATAGPGTDRRRLKVYVAAALGSEIGAVACALIPNLTRQFDSPLVDLSHLFAGAGLVAVGMGVELARRTGAIARGGN